jgi:phosphoribosylanthranilate isomerase
LVAARRSKVPLILSGGLTAENVAEAIARTSPYAVDTASGTESAPGRKDPEQLRAFFTAVGRPAPPPPAGSGGAAAGDTPGERTGAAIGGSAT